MGKYSVICPRTNTIVTVLLSPILYFSITLLFTKYFCMLSIKLPVTLKAKDCDQLFHK